MSEEQQPVHIKVKVDHTEVDQLEGVAKKSAKNVSKQTNKAFNQLGPTARKAIEAVSQQMEKMGLGITEEVSKGSQSGFKRMTEIAKQQITKVKKMLANIMPATQPSSTQPKPKSFTQQSEPRSSAGRTGALTSRYLAGILSAVATFGTLKTAIQNANEATETASLFATVWGQRASEVNAWITDLSDTLGVNQVEMQNTTATLFNMAKNLDLTSTQAQQLAQDLGMLSQDMASFYNMSSADVFSDIKSVLSGSGEVFSKYGAIINETTIKEYAYANGIARVGAELSIADKTLARYGLMMDKTSAAHGDLARTINSPANQARIFTNNLNKLSIALGKCFQPILVVVLPILNKLTLALSSVLESIATFTTGLMSLLGFDMSGLFGGTGGILETSGAIQEVANSVEGIGESASQAAKEAGKLAKGLLGIDTINNLSSTSSSSQETGTSGSVGTTLSFDLSSSLEEQESQLVGWMNRVAEAIVKITEKFKKGFNQNIGYVNKALENLKKSFQNLGQSIETFLVGAWNNGLEELVRNTGALTSAIVGAFLDISAQVTQVVANLFDYLNPATNQYTKKFLEALNTLVQSCEKFVKSISGWFATFVNHGGQAFLNVMGDIVMIIGTTLTNVLATCIQWVTDFFNSWAGQVVLSTVATTLNVLVGVLKAVLVVVEKLTPVWSGLLLILAGTTAISKTVTLFGTLQGTILKVKDKVIDFGLKIAANIEKFVLWGKQTSVFVKTLTGKFVTSVAGATKGVISFSLSLVKNAGQALASGLASIVAYVGGLLGLDGAMIASTLSAGALKLALDLLGIGLIVTAVIALVKVVIEIGKKFNWWSNISEWLSEKLGWVWNGIKSFFGWKDDNNVSDAFDETTESIETMGDTFEETTTEIETTSDRFGTVASKINQHFASIGFDAGKLANDLSEAESMFNEKFGMMSQTAQDYLDALATGNQEVLQEMSADSETYTAEILYSYQKLSDNEKNIFYETYGYIKGINDDWLNYNHLTYDQLMAKHASYSANIMSNETLTAQEKDRLIDEHLAKVEGVYQQELEALKQQREKILTNTELSENSRKQMLEDINAMIIQKEQEKTQDTIQGIESVTDAQQQATEAQTKAYESSTEAQVAALESVEEKLEETKESLSDFLTQSDKIASSIPKAWNGIGSKISLEFTKAKKQVTTEMQSLAKTVVNHFNQVKNSVSDIFNQLSNLMQGKLTSMNQNVKSQLSVMRNTIQSESNQFKNIFNQNLEQMASRLWSKFNDMLSDVRYFADQMKQAMNFTFPVPYLKMPHLSVSGNWDFEKKTVPKFHVNWYSSGGIFPSRTLIGVGDAHNGVGNNAEAVLPLDVLWKQMQTNFDRQNQQLLRAIQTNRGQGGTIILEVDKREIARGVFEGAEELARTGSLNVKWL
ncbi:hypothetical protein [Turicibacter sanguinis]|uniref:hypothetical protein n=1 Tax=Turicibacter sanguinis TaxID=154288 RepID=UPI0018AAD52B|nr:hypothetical protein [Turicibacter sanguinis]MDB8553882.1 hypothetical protein [Turicibacter sanguinis]